MNKIAVFCLLPAIFTIKPDEFTDFAGALDKMNKIGVTQGLEILKKRNALIYEDDVNHIYQIKVTPQEEKECWMHGPRNTFFLTALFSGVTESEFNQLYDAMLKPENIKAFKAKLRENLNYAHAIEICKPAGFGVEAVVKNLIADGKQIPKNSEDFQENITDFMYLEGLGDATDSGNEKNLIKAIKLMIEDVESIKNFDLLTLLANEACASGHFTHILPLLKKSISPLGIEMLFFTTMQHATALVISKENNTFYYFFADSLNNQNPKTSWNGRAEANIKHIKNFTENENLLHEAQLRLNIAANIDEFKELANEGLVGDVDFFVRNMIIENLNKLDLFKNTYKPFLMKTLKDFFPKEWEKIEVHLNKL